MKKDLLSVSDLGRKEIEELIERALHMKQEGVPPLLSGRTLALLFEKPSLRTRTSFELSEQRLSADIINFTAEASSLKKVPPRLTTWMAKYKSERALCLST